MGIIAAWQAAQTAISAEGQKYIQERWLESNLTLKSVLHLTSLIDSIIYSALTC